MKGQTMLKTSQVEEILVPVVIQILGSELVDRVEVFNGIDSDGADIIMMNVWVNGDPRNYDPKKALEALSAVNHKLSEEGDDRFVSMLPVFAGDEPGLDDETSENHQ